MARSSHGLAAAAVPLQVTARPGRGSGPGAHLRAGDVRLPRLRAAREGFSVPAALSNLFLTLRKRFREPVHPAGEAATSQPAPEGGCRLPGAPSPCELRLEARGAGRVWLGPAGRADGPGWGPRGAGTVLAGARRGARGGSGARFRPPRSAAGQALGAGEAVIAPISTRFFSLSGKTVAYDDRNTQPCKNIPPGT